ncbi:MAG TPA: leucine-rich repeat protein [Candidatus Alistipes merdavium]|nr:leucine-rich repeat protein [Candidatus Alistipes merdavium]
MRHTILFLAALTAFSCAKEPDVTPEGPEQKGTPITVTAHNAGYDTSSPASRAKFEGDNFGALTWERTERLGVYYHQATGDNWGIFNYGSDTESGGAIFVTPKGFVWNESAETHDFRAYYPYNERYHAFRQSNNSEAVTFTLPVNQGEFSYAESQLCIAETNDLTRGSEVHFQFKPVLAYLQLKLYTTDQVAEGEKIYLSQLKMYTEDQDGPIAGNYTVNMGTRAIIDGSSHTINFQLGSSTSSGLDITGYTSKENAYKFYAVMLPVNLSDRPLRFRGLVTHEKDNGDGTKSYTSYSMVARAKAGTAFKSGKGYAMTIEVQSDDSMVFPADADFAVRLGDSWVDFKDIYTEDTEGNITITMSPEVLMGMGSDLYFAANATKDVSFDRNGGQLAVISALVESMYAAQDGTDPIDVDLSNISFDGEFGLGGIFEDNVALGSIILPSGMTKINNPGFAGCTNLASVTLPETLKTIGGNAFQGCSSLKSIIIPNSVTSISGSAFDSCTDLTYVKLPDGITELNESTFRDCSALPTVTIPASVTAIGKHCFLGCTALAEITLLNPDAVVIINGDDTLENVGTSVAEGTKKKLRVPAALAEQYQSDSNWSELLDAGFVLETF